jgi:hypothetical protein
MRRNMMFTFVLVLWAFGSFGGSFDASASSHQMFEDEAALTATNAMIVEGRWDDANSPASWGTQYTYKLETLPLTGHVADFQPWSDIYWPTHLAGIAARWNWPGQTGSGFRYRPFTEAEVRRMSIEDLKRLSPAEKYDIFMGDFKYPTVYRIRAGTSPRAEWWMGICHGWSPAAINHAEPAAVVVTSDQGIQVPFGSGDVKALLDQYYAEPEHNTAEHFMGMRCQAGGGGGLLQRFRSPFVRGGSHCSDTNAGALHVVLTNELGLKHQGFVADIDRWRQVWNQPVFGFRSEIKGYRAPSRGATAGTTREAVVHTEMYYADELDQQSYEPVVGTPHSKVGTEKYDYSLELDANGLILGGEWISSDRPDFLWTVPKQAFTGYMAGINKIYVPAAGK